MSVPTEGFITSQLPQINSIWIDEDEETEKLYGLQAQLLRETGLDGDDYNFDIQLVNSTKPALNNKRNIELPPLRPIDNSQENGSNGSGDKSTEGLSLGHSKNKSFDALFHHSNSVATTAAASSSFSGANYQGKGGSSNSGESWKPSRGNTFLSKKLLLNRRKFLKLFKNKIQNEPKKALISTPFDFHHISHAGNRLANDNARDAQQSRSRVTSMHSTPDSTVDTLGSRSSSTQQHPQLSKAFVTESLPEIYQSHSRNVSFSHPQQEQIQILMQNHARPHSVTSSTYSSVASSDRVKSMSTVATTILEGTPTASKRLSYGQSNRNSNNNNSGNSTQHYNYNRNRNQQQHRWDRIKNEVERPERSGGGGKNYNYISNNSNDDDDDDDRRSNSTELSISFLEKYDFPTLLGEDQEQYDLPYDDDYHDEEEKIREGYGDSTRHKLGTSFLDPAQSRLRRVHNSFNSQDRFSINASPVREILQTESKQPSPGIHSPYRFMTDDSPVRTLSTPELEQLLFSDSQSRTVTVDDILRYYRDTITEMNSPYI